MARRVLKYRQQIERADALPDLRAFDLATLDDSRDDHLEHARIIDAAHRETRRKREVEARHAEWMEAEAADWDRRHAAARERRLIAGHEGQAVILKSSKELRAEQELREARAAARRPMQAASTMMAGSYMGPSPMAAWQQPGAVHYVHADAPAPVDFYLP